MKIAVLGFSGSGKSSLAKRLGIYYGIKTLHLDSVHWLNNWGERQEQEGREMVENFLKDNGHWVIDGNYTRYAHKERITQADLIIILLFNRFVCLSRVFKRYKKYKGTVREDMGENCKEKIDCEFVKWVLFEGRNKKRKSAFYDIARQYKDKTLIFKRQKTLDKWLNDNNINIDDLYLQAKA